MASDFQEKTEIEVRPPQKLPASNRLALMIVTGPSRGRYCQVSTEDALIGRGADTALSISDPLVSRRHAMVEYRDQEFWVRDLESRYGVYVEGEKITLSKLRDGDRIQFSPNTTIRVRFEDPTEAELMEQLQQAATTDSMTGIANRRYLMERLEQELAFAKRHHVPLTVLMIDVDHFKTVNDTLGHLEGDRLLKAVVGTMRSTARREDVLARYGGDEFIIIARGLTECAGVSFAGRMLDHVRESRPVVAGEPISVTISVGVASYQPSRHYPAPTTVRELLARADAAVYAAKAAGRDTAANWSSLADGLDNVADANITLG